MSRFIEFIAGAISAHSNTNEPLPSFSYEDIFDREYARDPRFGANDKNIYYGTTP
ncbi:hypothetical protein [Microbulbifer sp. A4B17]|uniref:hypothetical protein n=1 Tax=Microbulbifer sp. A4B17 TaxID=359370 RepID=UPI0013009517|nr:hypothetical protein [Microbulbifer sp. A4B17]